MSAAPKPKPPPKRRRRPVRAYYVVDHATADDPEAVAAVEEWLREDPTGSMRKP